LAYVPRTINSKLVIKPTELREYLDRGITHWQQKKDALLKASGFTDMEAAKVCDLYLDAFTTFKTVAFGPDEA
jgi:hypothetical protein